jgi:twitching motility two-component system response regulator PilH
MTRTILAIDDSLTLREFILRCLSRHSADYRIVLAKDGKEGLELAATENPDLLLLDFVLPDMKGDEVCRRLRANEKTAKLPVVLMSSSAAEMKRAEAEFDTVIKCIAKPFTPELLCATVSFGFREIAKKAGSASGAIPVSAPAPITGGLTRAVPGPAGIQLCGHTGQFSFSWVLYAIEQDHLTGVLRIFTGPIPIELYVAAGHPLVVTTRDGQAYLKQNRHVFTPEQQALLDAALRTQGNSSCPVFVSMAERRVMSANEAGVLCQECGLALFAQVWTAPRARFEFEAQAAPPSFTTGLPLFTGVIGEWAMETLRRVGSESASAMAWGEPTGIPAYTRRGYERIQQIPLNDEEVAFAALIGPTTSLAQIADSLQIDTETAQRILHRFLCLEIFDYWPASLLRAA